MLLKWYRQWLFKMLYSVYIFYFVLIKNDNEGDVDNAHDYKVLGEKGDSKDVHDKYRKDHVSGNTCMYEIQSLPLLLNHTTKE